jgi:hypothetical protein
MNNKPSLFIGSSSEGLPAAEEVKKQLAKVADIVMWNDGTVFQKNKSYLESLVNANMMFDFAVYIFTPDDDLKTRKKNVKTMRDNVLFEMGFSLGRLGINRSYIITEETVNIPSDLHGISISKFKKPGNKNYKDAVKKACLEIKQILEEQAANTELGFLPSTTTAIGYFSNFLARVCDLLRKDVKSLTINGKEWKKNDKEDNFRITVIIPEKLAYIGPQRLDDTLKEINLKSIPIKNPNQDPAKPGRDYPLYAKADIDTGDLLQLYDLPTTLFSSIRAIEMIVHKNNIGKNKLEDILQLRELKNFEQTLRMLLDYPENDIYRKYISIDYQEHYKK